MPILVTGFRRTGTSMAIKALKDMGVWLGESQNFARSGKKNPKGFWEHARMKSINHHVLKGVYGKFIWHDTRPYHTHHWDFDRISEDIRLRDTVIGMEIKVLEGYLDWGFKAPVMMYALPYWHYAIEDLKVVVMVRHPAESAKSLIQGRTSLMKAKKNNFGHGVRLWKNTYDHFLHYIQSDSSIDYLVTQYHQWVDNPKEVIAKVMDFCELSIIDNRLELSASEITPKLYRFDSDNVSNKGYKMAESIAGDTYEKILNLPNVI